MHGEGPAFCYSTSFTRQHTCRRSLAHQLCCDSQQNACKHKMHFPQLGKVSHKDTQQASSSVTFTHKKETTLQHKRGRMGRCHSRSPHTPWSLLSCDLASRSLGRPLGKGDRLLTDPVMPLLIFLIHCVNTTPHPSLQLSTQTPGSLASASLKHQVSGLVKLSVVVKGRPRSAQLWSVSAEGLPTQTCLHERVCAAPVRGFNNSGASLHPIL